MRPAAACTTQGEVSVLVVACFWAA
jgi:hypothetical protein